MTNTSKPGAADAPGRDDRRVRRLLGALKLGAVLVVVGVLTGTLVSGTVPSQSPPDPRGDRLATLMERYECSTRGLAEGQVPASAVLRTRSDALRMVDFDRGWAAYEGRAPGTLVAVCALPLAP